jgi:hypothetical protein
VSQSNFAINGNQSAALVLAELTAMFQALATTNSAASLPTTTFANQIAYNTTDNTFYLRNEANSAWNVLFTVLSSGGGNFLRIGAPHATGQVAALEVISTATSRSYTPNADTEVLVERVGNCGLTIISSNADLGRLNFGDTDAENVARVQYDHATNTMSFWTNGANRIEIASGGNLVLGGATSATGANYSVITPGRVQTEATYAATTASSADVVVQASGLLARSTSSGRFKTDIEPMSPELAEALVFGVEPIWYRSTCEADRADWSWWGFLAEDVAKVDPRVVHWGPGETGDLEPQGVMYDRFVPHLCLVLRDQRDRIAALEDLLQRLEKS